MQDFLLRVACNVSTQLMQRITNTQQEIQGKGTVLKDYIKAKEIKRIQLVSNVDSDSLMAARMLAIWLSRQGQFFIESTHVVEIEQFKTVATPGMTGADDVLTIFVGFYVTVPLGQALAEEHRHLCFIDNHRSLQNLINQVPRNVFIWFGSQFGCQISLTATIYILLSEERGDHHPVGVLQTTTVEKIVVAALDYAFMWRYGSPILPNNEEREVFEKIAFGLMAQLESNGALYSDELNAIGAYSYACDKIEARDSVDDIMGAYLVKLKDMADEWDEIYTGVDHRSSKRVTATFGGKDYDCTIIPLTEVAKAGALKILKTTDTDLVMGIKTSVTGKVRVELWSLDDRPNVEVISWWLGNGGHPNYATATIDLMKLVAILGT